MPPQAAAPIGHADARDHHRSLNAEFIDGTFDDFVGTVSTGGPGFTSLARNTPDGPLTAVAAFGRGEIISGTTLFNDRFVPVSSRFEFVPTPRSNRYGADVPLFPPPESMASPSDPPPFGGVPGKDIGASRMHAGILKIRRSSEGSALEGNSRRSITPPLPSSSKVSSLKNTVRWFENRSFACNARS